MMIDKQPIARGYGASYGIAKGIAVFDADIAEDLGKSGKEVILILPETAPDDVHGMLVARGVITSKGRITSHASVVCRALGLPCVAGTPIEIDEKQRQFSVL